MGSIYRTRNPKGGWYKVWRYRYFDENGKRINKTGTRNKAETMRLMIDAEERVRRIKLGLDTSRVVCVWNYINQYLTWGRSQGGKKNEGWSKEHAQKRETKIYWWRDRLGKKLTVEQFMGIRSAVDSEIRQLQEGGRTRRTVQTYGEAIKAFATYLLSRGIIKENPVAGLKLGRGKTKRQRRALTKGEIGRLYEVSEWKYQLLWRVALETGLRKGEIKALKVDWWDSGQQCLHIPFGVTKNGDPVEMPVSGVLAEWLDDAVETQYAYDLYQKDGYEVDTDVLVWVPVNPERRLYTHLAKADIPKETPAGIVDFHALRVTFVTRLIEEGVDIKTVQELARHRTIAQTMEIYAKTDISRKRKALSAILD